MIEVLLGAHKVLLRHEALEPGGFPPEGCAVKVLVTSLFNASEVHNMFQSNEEDEEEYFSILDMAEMPIVGYEISPLQYESRCMTVTWKGMLISKIEGSRPQNVLTSTFIPNLGATPRISHPFSPTAYSPNRFSSSEYLDCINIPQDPRLCSVKVIYGQNRQ